MLRIKMGEGDGGQGEMMVESQQCDSLMTEHF